MSDSSARSTRTSRSRQALTDAAVQIVAADGIDGLSADRIAAVAGVSRRTLFNHFDRVEDVLTASVEDLMAETIDAVMERPSDEPLRVALCAVLEDIVDSPAFAQIRDLERAAATSPATRRVLLEFGDRQATAMEEGLRRRIGPHADPVYVSTLAGAAAAVLGRATRLAVEGPTTTGTGATDHHIALIRQAFDLLFDGFDEAAATIPSSTSGSQES
jgi:AcrR family transcriptional regulator